MPGLGEVALAQLHVGVERTGVIRTSERRRTMIEVERIVADEGTQLR